MPQLNPEFFVSQLFWLIVTFSFLLVFLWRISLPRINTVLEKRESKINNDIETAKQLQTEAEEIQNEIEKQIIKAKEKTNLLIKDSSKKIQNNTEEELNKLDRELNKKIDDSIEILESNKKKSLSQIHNQINEITKLTLSKLTNLSITTEEINESVDDIRSKEIN